MRWTFTDCVYISFHSERMKGCNDAKFGGRKALGQMEVFKQKEPEWNMPSS